jgi:hypothetical protein
MSRFVGAGRKRPNESGVGRLVEMSVRDSPPADNELGGHRRNPKVVMHAARFQEYLKLFQRDQLQILNPDQNQASLRSPVKVLALQGRGPLAPIANTFRNFTVMVVASARGHVFKRMVIEMCSSRYDAFT